MISIAIVEDDKKLRRDLAELLSFDDDLNVTGSFNYGEDGDREKDHMTLYQLPSLPQDLEFCGSKKSGQNILWTR